MQSSPRRFYAPIFLISLATLLLEISYTRIFSFKVYYYFTYLILGVALMGVGAGGVAVALSPRLRADPERWIPRLCLATSLAVVVGYLIIAPAPLNASQIVAEPLELIKLAAVVLTLAAPFLGAGICIALILSGAGERVNRLYAADLAGAALGCAVCVPLLYALGPPACVVVSGLLFAAVALPQLRLASGAVVVVLAFALAVPGLLPDTKVDASKRLDEYRNESATEFSVWNPVFRIDVTDNPFAPGMLLLFHDGRLGSIIRRYDGDPESLADLQSDQRSLPFAVLDPGPRVLVIGAAGGHEVLASLLFGASRVVGVELNPATIELLTDTFADYSGRFFEDPRVELINDEGRSFLRRSNAQYDLIWFVAPDSYAAMNASTASSFVMTESYLYTVEMIREAYEHLTPNGLIVVNFGEMDFERRPNRTTRYLRTAREAFSQEGIDDFERHVMVSTSEGLFTACTIALSRAPLSPERVNAFREQLAQVVNGRARYLPGVRTPRHDVRLAIELAPDALRQWTQSHAYRIDPVRDDSPFFWHFTRFRDAPRATAWVGRQIVDYEEAIGELLLLVLLMLVVLVAFVMLLLPFVSVRSVFRALPHKAGAALYFAALGVGFMLLEVSLIQMLTLLLGYPTYSLSVTLLSLLLFAGVGSFASELVRGHRNPTLVALLALTALMVAFYITALPVVIDVAGGAPLGVRIVIAVVLVAPLGFALGAYLPLGLATVEALGGANGRVYVAWSWAINGFFSVIASVLAAILGMSFGFRAVLLIALVVYAIGAAALARLPRAS